MPVAVMPVVGAVVVVRLVGAYDDRRTRLEGRDHAAGQ
jgi:hypothetical protein